MIVMKNNFGDANIERMCAMDLTEREAEIVKNMRYPSVQIKTRGQSYKDLSNDELDALINKIDDYAKEYGEMQRSFGNYDEFYKLEFNSIKLRLESERQCRKFC